MKRGTQVRIRFPFSDAEYGFITKAVPEKENHYVQFWSEKIGHVRTGQRAQLIKDKFITLMDSVEERCVINALIELGYDPNEERL